VCAQHLQHRLCCLPPAGALALGGNKQRVHQGLGVVPANPYQQIVDQSPDLLQQQQQQY
jgi:hypothetical protein